MQEIQSLSSFPSHTSAKWHQNLLLTYYVMVSSRSPQSVVTVTQPAATTTVFTGPSTGPSAGPSATPTPLPAIPPAISCPVQDGVVYIAANGGKLTVGCN